MKTLTSIFIFLTLLFHAVADPPMAKGERDWKKFLRAKRFDRGQSIVETERRLDARIAMEFDSDHGFAEMHDVYYVLDSQWYAIASYRSSGRSNFVRNATGAERAKMVLDVVPGLVRNSPEFQAHLEQIKGLGETWAKPDLLR